MPPRAPGPHPRLEPGPSAADPARVRDPPQPAPASPLSARCRAAETATRAGRSRPVPRPKTRSRRWPDQRISPGRMTWTRFSAQPGRIRRPGRHRRRGRPGEERAGGHDQAHHQQGAQRGLDEPDQDAERVGGRTGGHAVQVESLGDGQARVPAWTRRTRARRRSAPAGGPGRLTRRGRAAPGARSAARSSVVDEPVGLLRLRQVLGHAATVPSPSAAAGPGRRDGCAAPAPAAPARRCCGAPAWASAPSMTTSCAASTVGRKMPRDDVGPVTCDGATANWLPLL